jgi:tetratricopeptide (TPR) repeat protein
MALEEQGRTPEAVDELRATIAIHPTAYEPSYTLVNLYVAHKDHRSAIAEMRRFLDAVSSLFPDQSKFVDFHFGELNELVNLLVADRALDAAAEEYFSLLRFRPNDSRLRNEYGNVLIDLHRYDDALRQFDEAARLTPGWSEARKNIGLCLAFKKNLDGAIEAFHEVLEENPGDFRARVYLSSALGRKGQLEESNEQLRQVAAISPPDPEVHIEIGYALESINDVPAAIRELKLGLKVNPGSAGGRE